MFLFFTRLFFFFTRLFFSLLAPLSRPGGAKWLFSQGIPRVLVVLGVPSGPQCFFSLLAPPRRPGGAEIAVFLRVFNDFGDFQCRGPPALFFFFTRLFFSLLACFLSLLAPLRRPGGAETCFSLGFLMVLVILGAPNGPPCFFSLLAPPRRLGGAEMAVFLRVFNGFGHFGCRQRPDMFFSLLACSFSLLACFFSLLVTSKERKHWPLLGLQNSLLTRDGKPEIKSACP